MDSPGCRMALDAEQLPATATGMALEQKIATGPSTAGSSRRRRPVQQHDALLETPAVAEAKAFADAAAAGLPPSIERVADSRALAQMRTITVRNKEQSPFLRLPYELRLMIYEHAVCYSKPLQPLQITRGSNLFVWDKYKYSTDASDPSVPLHVLVPDSTPLVYPQLLTICRQTYYDLQSKPVFYRVNRVSFDSFGNLHRFLASLTPPRRKTISKVALSLNKFGFADRARTCQERLSHMLHALTLLKRSCHVQDLIVNFNFSKREVPTPLQVLEALLGGSSQEHGQSVQAPSTRAEHYYMSLTVVGLQDDVLRKAENWLNINVPHIARKRIAFGRLQWGLEMTVPCSSSSFNKSDCELVQGAVEAARIDFPGEARMLRHHENVPCPPYRGTRNRLLAHRDQIEKKTDGAKCRWGTLEDGSEPKYDLDGRLNWRVRSICDIRYHADEATIECKVKWLSAPAGYQPTSWEPLYTLVTRQGLYLLNDFYDRLWKSSKKVPEDTGDAGRLHETFQSLPRPKHAIQEIGTLHIDDHKFVKSAEYEKYLQRFLKWDSNWDDRVSNIALAVRNRRLDDDGAVSAEDSTMQDSRGNTDDDAAGMVERSIVRARFNEEGEGTRESHGHIGDAGRTSHLIKGSVKPLDETEGRIGDKTSKRKRTAKSNKDVERVAKRRSIL